LLQGLRFGWREEAELRLHYRTLGTPVRDTAGHVTNAVMILHGTGGRARNFATAICGGIVGAGSCWIRRSITSFCRMGLGTEIVEPSDGLHAKFPQYDYDDMWRRIMRC